MKKALIILIVFLTTSSLNAQTLKGNLFAGGYAYYNHHNNKYGESEFPYFNLFLNPRLGYFFTDNFAGGISGTFNFSKEIYNNETSEYEFMNISPGAGIFAIYYKNLSNNIYLSCEGGLGYNSHRNESHGEKVSTGNTIKLQLKPGFAYFITPHWAFDAGIELLRYNVDYDKITATGSKRTSKVLMINADLSNIFIGVNYHF